MVSLINKSEMGRGFNHPSSINLFFEKEVGVILGCGLQPAPTS